MPSVKNKWVKPGGSFNYTEGQKVLNQSGNTLAKHAIVQITGVAGGVGIVTPADGTDPTGDLIAGRLLILRHAIPDGRYGVGTPWIIVTGTAKEPLDTSAGGVGDPVYIDATGSGGWTLTAPSGAGGADRVIGYILVQDAETGAISFANTAAI